MGIDNPNDPNDPKGGWPRRPADGQEEPAAQPGDGQEEPAAQAGDGQEEPAGPLHGVRVVDLTRALSGPFCTLVLASLGADVIKVEDPAGGDVARGNAPYLGANGLTLFSRSPDELSLALLNRCRGKRSVTLDLKHPGAQVVFDDLVAQADVVVENFSSGTADRLGVGYDHARQVNPAIVYCSISGFGSGNDPGTRAMDTIIQALSGAMLTSGGPGDPPVRVGLPLADVLTPVWAVVGILAALHRRQRTGSGEHVDVSMLGVLTSLVATEDWSALEQLGLPLRTGPTLPRLAPFGLYRCADGWVSLVAPQEKLATALFGAMGHPELGSDPRFADRDSRVHHDAELTVEIERWSSRRAVADVVSILESAGVPVAPVRTPQEAVSDPRVTARHETDPVLHPTLGTFDGLRTAGIPLRLSGSPVRLSGSDAGLQRPAPRLGQHTEEVLAEVAGYDKERIDQLRHDGPIR